MRITWVLVSLLLIPGASPASMEIELDPCFLYKTSILVSGESNELFLCKGSKSIANYSVAFGSNGLGKKRPGDRKTPVGTYRVGRPRVSRSSYHIFIPIRIPKGIGTAVGIHGPRRSVRYLGPLNTVFDWTAGCIAMGSDSAIEDVAQFVRLNRNLKIHVLPPAHWADSILKQEMTQLETGDLIFQTSKTKVALTVLGSTGSVLTHVGLIVMRRGKPWVMEAVGPVKYTSLNQFVNRGINEFFSIKRPIVKLRKHQKRQLVDAARRYLGRPYDHQFRWDDDRQYCSEFVYKSYIRGLKIKLAETEKIGDLYASWNPLTHIYVRKAYGRKKVNRTEPVITPQQIYESSLLNTVIDTYPF